MKDKFIIGMILGLVSLAIAGCTSGTIYVDKTTGEVVQVDYEILHIQQFLPPTAKEIEKLGNGWFTFELQDGEKLRKFMVREHRESHVSNGIVITELSLTKPCTCATMSGQKETNTGLVE